MFISLLASFKPINTLVDAAFIAIFVPFENQTDQCSQFSCIFVRFFFQICSLPTTSMLPNFRCNKTRVEKMKSLVQY